jgi:hypothetical protein
MTGDPAVPPQSVPIEAIHGNRREPNSLRSPPLQRFVGELLSLALLVSLVIAMSTLYQRQLARDVALRSPQASALKDYVARSPFDAAGHLAIASEGAAANLPANSSASAALAAANTLAPHNPDVLRLVIFRNLQAGDAETAITAGERLAKIDPMAQPDIVKALSTLGNSPVWAKTIERWQTARSPLLEELVFNVCQSDAPITRKLQFATSASAADVLSNRSFECLRTASLRSPEFASVYALWIERILRKRPGEAVEIANVFNGDFSRAIENEPFDWKLGAGGDFRDGYVVRVKRETTDGVANRFLEAELNGRPIKSDIATTMTALPRGRYLLSYRVRDTSQATPHRFRLSLRCIGGAELNPASQDRLPAQIQGATVNEWTSSTATIVVPEGCYGQQLSLESTRANWKALGVNGRVAIDDVVISFGGEAP